MSRIAATLTRGFWAALILIGAATAAQAAAPSRQYISPAPASATAPAAPFSEGILVGRTFYLAGHLGTDAAGHVPADTASEVRLVLDAIQHTLAQAHLSMDDLVSVTVFCSDLSLYDTFNGIYRGYFHHHYPTRAFIGVKDLVRGAHFEIEGIAVKP